MVTRSGRPSAINRFQAWKESKLVDIRIVKQSLEYCYRLAKRGRSSGLIIPLIDSFETADQVLSNLRYRDLVCSDYSNGEITFTNGAKIKIFTLDQKTMVKQMLGLDAEVVMADDGDPRADKAEKVLNF